MSDDMLKVGAPLPAHIGRCADLYHDVRDLRLAMEKEVEAIKERETEIQNHIIDSLSATDGDTGAAGLKYRAQLVIKRKPRIAENGWGIFTSWVRKHDYFNMLQKRLNEAAVAEFLEQNPDRAAEGLPGLEMFNAKTLSVTKI